MSNDGTTWVDAFCGKYFAANDDRNSKARIFFPKPISARLIRIYPVTWCGITISLFPCFRSAYSSIEKPVLWSRRGAISMRAAVITCEQPCVKGQLEFPFREDYESSSGGPSLNPAWGEGTFDTALGPYQYAVLHFLQQVDAALMSA